MAIALTFDDGPDPRFTPRLLDLLAGSRVPATFFVIASLAVEYPEIIRRMLDEGHAVESHGWTHRHAWLQSSKSASMQVRRAGDELALLSGRAPRWFRPPYGRLRPAMRAAAAAAGQRVALWSRSAVDWGPAAKASQISARLGRVEAGDIILMHDGRNRHNRPAVTLEALPGFLSLLADRGLQATLLPD
ncbi:MAG: polysaccharide deacetylase family protein [Wenzhouxiangellaceae bacterium]|nr:polysaccharide deacetylase family protein [Wenzhouxiangellaceae bacterium]